MSSRAIARLLFPHALGLIQQRDFLFLHLGHEAQFLPLHRYLVVIDLAFALRGQVSGRAHRQRIGHDAGHAGHDDYIHIHLCADDAGNQAEVGGQAVVESVHHIAQQAAGPGAMPRFADAAGHLRQRLGMMCGLGGEPLQGLGGRTGASLPIQRQVSSDLRGLLPDQNRVQHARSEDPADPGESSGTKGGAARAGGDGMFGENPFPDGYMLSFDVGELAVERTFLPVG